MDTSVQYVVSGAPEGKVSVAVRIASGSVETVEVGKLSDPDITVSLSYEEARALATGETSADESFMRGATKVDGDHAAWLLELRDLRGELALAVGDLLD